MAAAKPKPKRNIPKPAAKPKPKKRARSPVKAGQLRNLSKISVGNIITKTKKKAPAGWPKWTETVLNNAYAKKAIAWMKEEVQDYEDDGEDVDWQELRKELEDKFYVKT